ncbi:hypothetical protein [Flavobacterium nitratireducens]|uniref:hypothetical protein n=1 Tax=Flavobacterium nitratireducens TaxID=992289 RepID=UPI0024155AA4|nr:hypothetical protein [Flavobacterium nitratireducens]
MKKLLFLLSFIILSCSSDQYDFKSIEIMSYYYSYEDNSKVSIDRIFYSYINSNGLSQTIKRTGPTGEEKYYVSKTDPRLLNSIVSETKNKDENYFKQSIDTLDIDIYDGPIIRFKITDKNMKTKSFTFDEGKDLKKLSLYYNLYKTLNNSLNIRPLDNSILEKQKKFEQFAINKDTSELVVPRPPKMKVKFIKIKN